MTLVAFAVLLGVVPKLAYGIPLLPSIQPLIIGGEDAPIGFAPHSAALLAGEPESFIVCGASIISRKLLLTAAHCIEPSLVNGTLPPSFQARIGSNQWNSGGTIIKIKDHYIHPQWNSTILKYDAAVLVTREKIVLTEFVAIIRVSFDHVGGNERALVAGWGRTGPRFVNDTVNLQPTPDDLQYLSMNTMHDEECKKLMAEVGGSRVPHVQPEIEICTFHSKGHGMCLGDSGSALIRWNTGELIGIVSWGYYCAVGGPDVYVRPSGIKTFLQPIMEKHRD